MKFDWVDFFVFYLFLVIIVVLTHELAKADMLWPLLKVASFVFVPPTIVWILYNKFLKD